ncbi:putative DNA helicase INO80 [Erysiphe neolycopersici]|uniref:Chromatin-remodeling ATPase INO80 n=1 Tax=Erysiphe neolycopersici TaxID=212602 RepID=A0A420HH13_9PEZI|nr:putative DNA helicase INO80 [Erysiphe neolycopersici]
MDPLFHSTVMRHSEGLEENDGARQERLNGAINSNTQTYAARSPTLIDIRIPFSPTHGELHLHSNHKFSTPTTTALPMQSGSSDLPSPHLLASPPILSTPSIYQDEYHSTTRNYYDPTSDSSNRQTLDTTRWTDVKTHKSHISVSSQLLLNVGHIKSDNNAYSSNLPVSSLPSRSPTYNKDSPTRQSFTLVSPLMTSITSPSLSLSGAAARTSKPAVEKSSTIENFAKKNSAIQNSTRPVDPMAFSSILSNTEPILKPYSKQSVQKKSIKNQVTRSEQLDTPLPLQTPGSSRVPAKRKANGEPKGALEKPKISMEDQEMGVQAVVAQIDADASDIELDEFLENKQIFTVTSLKRRLEVENIEIERSKRRRSSFMNIMATKFGRHATFGELRYRDVYLDSAITIVQEKEIKAEKERKKDMQRKRRREKTVAANIEQKEIAIQKAKAAENEAERQKFIREAQRAEKKAHQTKIILEQGDQKSSGVSPAALIESKIDGNMLSSHINSDETPKLKPKRGGARLRKSKEQKQAEKDSAEAAQAAIDARDESIQAVSIKEEPKIRLKINRDESPATATPFISKGYNQIYDQIWRDLARKDVNKVYKIAGESCATKVSNLKKTAILASKEAKRWQLRTNKGTKDLQARAKRVMREMASFWKRNEREERDTRRAAEKQEIENAKKAEADREANRQKRKLNFLISQTELYSHFISKKIKTDEIERSTDHPDVEKAKDPPIENVVNLQNQDISTSTNVTRFGDLDFDADDDSALKAAAMANAQNAIQEAQNKARAFNKQDDSPTLDEEGEMNFQNPAGLDDIEIEQPKLLQAQLKEYQLKGLNWLVNLYEQGINGILADEMGLGKTVQSISVMAYLAEKHGIWGPFLVVAPASTLHNWQQEITKFVPALKVLPYWGTGADRKVLRKFWDRRHMAYTKDSAFHVLITSYQLVVSDVSYFQKMKWQYMILDEAQAIKSSQSSRWKVLLSFNCRNRLLLTGTPIQNNMQELWALLHFIMPSLFDSHDEFSEWFSKDIESHAQSNTKLNEDQLKRLHMILKPFMLRRVKKHVQKELGDKIEIDLFCDLTYRQRAYYNNLRNQISIMDLIEKVTIGDDNDSGTLMNLVMQFRKVCNHPDLFERADTSSPFSFSSFAQCGSLLREGSNVEIKYSTRNAIEYILPKLIWRNGGRIDLPGQDNWVAGFKKKYVDELFSIFNPEYIHGNLTENNAFSFLPLSGTSISQILNASRNCIFKRAVDLMQESHHLDMLNVVYDEDDHNIHPHHQILNICNKNNQRLVSQNTNEGYLNKLLNIANYSWEESGLSRLEPCGEAKATAPPIEVICLSSGSNIEREKIMFNISMRRALFGPSLREEKALITSQVEISNFPQPKMLPAPSSEIKRFTNIQVPSMRRFVTDSGKLAKLDKLLFQLKEGGHRVLLYFQMTRMIDLMEEYLTYRNYKYLRLDGSTKLEDRRDTVHDFQTRPEIFIFLLSTRAGGLGINLTTADTVIFYDSDWNPTIDSQAMDRAHRLGQTKQVTVYRMITRGTIEERIRKRALQKEEVQKVVMTGGAGVDFNTRSKENRTKDIAMWLVDDDEAAEIERKEQELAEKEAREPEKKRGKGKSRRAEGKSTTGSLEDLYHEGEGHFDDKSNKVLGSTTSNADAESSLKAKRPRKSGSSKKAKTTKQKLAMADGSGDIG